jgi:N6-adenosine-specific RNA methylase IME4
VWDGWHRIRGAKAAELETVPANVQQGTVEDARWHASSANQTPGLRRSNEDKGRAIRLALSHPRAATMSNYQIAEHCGVNEITVRRHRESSGATMSHLNDDPKRQGKDGKWYPATKTRQSVSERLAGETLELLKDTPLADPESKQDLGKLARLEPELQREVSEKIVQNGAITVRQAIREAKKAEYEERLRVTPLPDQRYRVIYADPPWQYGNSGLDEYGHVERHYDTMSLPEMCDLDVAGIVDDHAVLFLWVTSPMLEDAFKVIKAWGFEYKTSFVWDKVKHNFGYYNSVRHEFLLVCTRGSCLPDEQNLHDSVVEIERSNRNSEKPVYFRDLIDRLYPLGRRIELFARTQGPGEWEAWGNEFSHTVELL